jgi:PAS domain S-box-containing protein
MEQKLKNLKQEFELHDQRQYRRFAESNPNLAFIADADGTLDWYNQRWFEYTGTSAAQMQGWGWQSVHDPAVLPGVMTSWLASIESGRPFEMTFPLRAADGSFRPFLTRVVPVKDPQDKIVRWYGTSTDVSDQMAATIALRQSEQRFKTATEAVMGVLWTNDAAGEMRGEQRGWSEFTGQTQAEYEGYGWSNAVHPDDAQATIDAWQQAVFERRRFSFEHRVRRHDGMYRTCSIRALPILEDDGSIREWVGVHTDITEDRRTQQALADSDERLRLALTAANGVGTWDWDVVNDLVYANEGFAQIYGVSSEDALTGLPISDFTRNIHPGDAARVKEAIDAAMRTGEDFRSEYRVVQPDGSVRWVSAVGRCQRNAAGVPLRFPGFALDVTDMRRADDALRMSEESHRIAAEVTRLGHCRLDTSTRTLLSCTPIFKANYGRAPDEDFTYPDLLASIHPEDRERVRETVSAAIRDNVIYRAEYRVFWPDGSLHWISASGRLIHLTDGRAPQMAGVTLDVTQKHMAEAALLQAEKLAAVGRLASSIAHEINNPLESVTNLLYIARGSGDMPEIYRMLDMAEAELRRVSIIANQTLRFHKQASYPREISCIDLFSSVISMYEGKLRNSGITVEKRKRANRPVRIYEGDIRQVLNNVFGNAIDAMPTGGRMLLRSRESRDWKTGAAGIVLTIADTGTGMSAETLSHIFDAFFTTKGIQGTGLGLWISMEIMQRHRGRITIRSSQSANHRGTVVNLFLPFEAGAVELTSETVAA